MLITRNTNVTVAQNTCSLMLLVAAGHVLLVVTPNFEGNMKRRRHMHSSMPDRGCSLQHPTSNTKPASRNVECNVNSYSLKHETDRSLQTHHS